VAKIGRNWLRPNSCRKPSAIKNRRFISMHFCKSSNNDFFGKKINKKFVGIIDVGHK
jgi:hypothetical protein